MFLVPANLHGAHPGFLTGVKDGSPIRGVMEELFNYPCFWIAPIGVHFDSLFHSISWRARG